MDHPTRQISTYQVDLFYSRLPERPYATDELGTRLLITSRRRAVRRRYIQANPPWMRIFPVFDVDRPGAALAWSDGGLPPPLWTAANPENAHAHSAWCLAAPVLLGEGDRQEPMRYLCAIEECMREALQADWAYGGLITKNPLHRHWRVLWGPPCAYELGELAEYLPGLERHKPRGRPELFGLGRNVDVFDHLRHYAYREIRLWWTPPRRQGVFVAWMTHLYQRGLEFTANEHPRPLDSREVHYVAKSVARWVWNRFSADRLSEIQTRRGRKGGRTTAERAGAEGMAARGRSAGAVSGERRRAAVESRDREIRRLHDEEGLSQRAIANKLGIPRGVVLNVLRRVDHEPSHIR